MTQIVDQSGFVPDRFTNLVVNADHTGAEQDSTALWLAPDADLAPVLGDLDRLSLIVIPFETSADGRGFSLAKALREAGYGGHLRARGAVLVDQFRAALRCGFDDVEISDEHAVRTPEPLWRAALLGASYQARVFA